MMERRFVVSGAIEQRVILAASKAGARFHDEDAREVVRQHQERLVACAQRSAEAFRRQRPRVAKMPGIKIGTATPEVSAHASPQRRPASGVLPMPGIAIGGATPAPRRSAGGVAPMPGISF